MLTRNSYVCKTGAGFVFTYQGYGSPDKVMKRIRANEIDCHPGSEVFSFIPNKITNTFLKTNPYKNINKNNQFHSHLVR